MMVATTRMKDDEEDDNHGKGLGSPHHHILGIRGGLEGLDFDEYGCFSECFHFHCL
jgi:hypothetical protein